ncbi:HAMP domain-containing sensor histidine kinase [Fusobacterium sp.]|uniref:sensor histidine kinase n=3 Tax=Fusobacterium sp. TaxID=68766 RepID=UPI00261EC979|nr:HAMP domain-containing sensor histidine kinase [Fusobacterium sp.]
MRKLSKELTKTYRLLIFIFSISFLGLLTFFTLYIKQVSREDILSVHSFLKYEMLEFEEEFFEGHSLDELFYGALEEAPKVNGVTVIFKHNNSFYPNDIPDLYKEILNRDDFSNSVQSIGFYKYDFLDIKTIINNIGEVDLLIIKDLTIDRTIILNIIILSFLLILSTIFVSIYISRKFYNRFIVSLDSLQEITNNIDLNNIDDHFESENNFIEFNNVIISYENMLKRLKEQTDAQVDFVNNASHELKTPIFIIDGYINLIKRWGINNKEISSEAIDSICEETKNMNSLVQKLLFLAKDNKNIIEIQNINLTDIIQNILSDLKIIYPNQKIFFTGKEIFIKSDPHLIRQLFLNLIENAIKYGKENPIEIEIAHNKNISVSIKDFGEGISEENLEHIYDKFFRVDKARSRNMGSHGLGMSIVKKIITILNIDLDIKSTLNKGTTIIVTLPLSSISSK